jgi:hypothetical protein
VENPPKAEAPAEQKAVTGTLRLNLAPPTAMQQLFVDGYYLGTVEQFDDGVELEAGPHQVEIRADGYQTVTFNVNIVPGRSITYRDTLKVETAASAPAPAAGTPAVSPSTPAIPASTGPTPPATFYVIPGCYVGNTEPTDEQLPAGCDKDRLTRIRP